ncbi:MAG: hypothetical protein COA78_20230 [Blastopirellula sp.]|nr:MAG: hypothetical protein COA78_20230 [Blastopirellula sp.]
MSGEDIERIHTLETQSALQKQKIYDLEKRWNGVYRGLWLIGGGFVSVVVFWLTRGGANG